MGSSAFFTGLSGLKANSTGLNVVGDNLANSNTIAYKSKNTFFNELLASQKLEIQAGQGLQDNIRQAWNQGGVQQSNSATDLAIFGDGFFVVEGEAGSTFYARDGNLHLDAEGFLVSSGDLKILGYPVVDGEVQTAAQVGPLNLGAGTILEAQPTERMRLTINLNESKPLGNVFRTTLAVHDTLGESHLVSVEFTKTAINEWDYSMTVPAVDVGGLPGDPDVMISTGTLMFGSEGELISPTGDITGLTISGLANGADDIIFDWALFDSAGDGAITQVKLPSATAQTFQDGNGAGSLTSITVRKDGIIEGLFSNGFAGPLGQIVIATFTNNQGLVRSNENAFAATSVSGEPNVGIAGTGGRGNIIGGALETSNVDIAEEFIKLIIFQRAYQANSRMITTADEVTQETIQLKR